MTSTNTAADGLAPQPRILMDLSTACRATGQPVGIVRVERALARWARLNRSDVDFIFFDPRSQRYHRLEETWLDKLLDGTAYLDSWLLPEAGASRIRFIDRFPSFLQPAMRFVLRLRRQILMTLEARRLRTGDPKAAAMIDRLQRFVMSPKYARLMIQPDGTRRPLLPPDLVVGATATPGQGDIIVNAGAGWTHSSIEGIAALKESAGIRFALVVYDLIPIKFPHYFAAHDVAAFELYMRAALKVADEVLCASRCTRSDVEALCRQLAIPVGETRVVPLGADVARPNMQLAPQVPLGLASGRYILFVSTIEPRKGHRFLLEVWRRLLEAGVPQAQDFSLVFVGRMGWMVDALKAEIDRALSDGARLSVHSNVADEVLAALYAHAAFCVYPSEYEGYGLPVAEAFRNGKTVVASDRGSIPEVVGDFSPCLPADDAQAWFDTLSSWMSDPAARQPYETAIRERFRPTTWDEAAKVFFDGLGSLARED